MKSRWFELKETAIALRKTGMSMTVIERRLGIPRSTLSGWFKTVPLTEEQRTHLMKNKQDGWAKARIRAAEVNRAQKALRLLRARQEAEKTLSEIKLSNAVLDLAFAMLYFGEGKKSGSTTLASSDPKILGFVLTVLNNNYKISRDMIKCELHLRPDQNIAEIKEYWSRAIDIPLENFKWVYVDKRSLGKPTYDHYKGVCVLHCGSIAIQRKLIYLYNLFCEKVANLDAGT